MDNEWHFWGSHILLMINVTSFGMIPDYTSNSGPFSHWCFASKNGEDNSFFSKNMSTLGRSNPQDPPSGCHGPPDGPPAKVLLNRSKQDGLPKLDSGWMWYMLIPCHCNPNIMGIYIYIYHIYICILLCIYIYIENMILHYPSAESMYPHKCVFSPLTITCLLFKVPS